jgi:hypothetical protein
MGWSCLSTAASRQSELGQMELYELPNVGMGGFPIDVPFPFDFCERAQALGREAGFITPASDALQ